MSPKTMNITSIGPVTKSRRDEVKDLRDSLGHDNYNETLGYLLENIEENISATDD
ncbi:hypothetical protein ACLI4Z_15905 [Natrialbaceae archaeon A-arb3/5]